MALVIHGPNVEAGHLEAHNRRDGVIRAATVLTRSRSDRLATRVVVIMGFVAHVDEERPGTEPRAQLYMRGSRRPASGLPVDSLAALYAALNEKPPQLGLW